jgi:hypothetical protein
VHVVVRPTTGRPLDPAELESLSRASNAIAGELGDDGSARLAFDAGRYDAATARGNVEMAARMTLGAHWQVRYEVAEG